MMGVPSGVQIHLATAPVDFRKAIDGLSGVVCNVLRSDPASGHLFVFHCKNRRAMKLLYWDHGGFVVVHKRLAQGRFRLPDLGAGVAQVRMTSAELAALFEGIDLSRARRLPRWNPPTGLVDLHPSR